MTLLLLLVGCAPEPEALSFQRDVEPLIRGECALCHRGRTADAELDLGDDPYAALVGAQATQSELLLVEPGDHLYSYLWHKLNGTQTLAGGSGTAMPLYGLLPADEVALVAAWIDAGALP